MAYNLLDVIDRASPRSGILTSELQLGSISGGEEEHEHCDETQHHDIRFSGRITRLSADPAKVHDDCSTTSGGRPLRASSSSRGSAASSSAAIVNRALPSLAVSVLKEWLLDPEHIDNPYPSDQQKEELAMQTGLSVKQISVWFTNNRKRVWLPLRNQLKGAPSTGTGSGGDDHDSDSCSAAAPASPEPDNGSYSSNSSSGSGQDEPHNLDAVHAHDGGVAGAALLNQGVADGRKRPRSGPEAGGSHPGPAASARRGREVPTVAELHNEEASGRPGPGHHAPSTAMSGPPRMADAPHHHQRHPPLQPQHDPRRLQHAASSSAATPSIPQPSQPQQQHQVQVVGSPDVFPYHPSQIDAAYVFALVDGGPQPGVAAARLAAVAEAVQVARADIDAQAAHLWSLEAALAEARQRLLAANYLAGHGGQQAAYAGPHGWS